MPDNKRVSFFISSLSGGGAEGVCVNIANGFVENGISVDLVLLNLKNEVYKSRLSENVNLIELGVDHARNSILPILKYILNNKPKTILVFNYEFAVILVLLRSIFRFKTKIIARNINTLSQKHAQAQGLWRKYIVKRLIDSFYCNVDHVINQCQAMRNDLIALYPQMAKKSSVIYNPVAKHIEDYIKSHDLAQVEKKDYLLCVGRLEKQKAFHYAIEGFAGVVKDFPSLRLKIVGQGSLEQSLKQCAIDFGVENSIDFEGFQADMIPYYLQAKAVVLTSLYEGFPNVLLESVVLGTPVIAFDCPSGPREIVQNGVNGYLVKYLSKIDFKKKLDLLFLMKFESEKVSQVSKEIYLKDAYALYKSVIDSVN